MAAMNDLYILVNNEATGPFALEQLEAMIASGELSADTLYAEEGGSSWRQLSTIIQVPASHEAADGESEIYTGAQLSRCRLLFECRQTLSKYSGVRDWKKRVSEEANALPATLRSLDHLIAAEVQKRDLEKQRFEQQSFLKRTFGSHDAEEAVEHRISALRIERGVLAKLVEEMHQKGALLPESPTMRDALVKEIRHRVKELKAKKKEATIAMTAIRREARVASDGAGKTWIGLYDSSLAADQRRGIRHAKEEALRPYEDAKESIESQVIALEKHAIWLENFE